MPNPNFIRDYPVPLDLSPGDQIPVQPAGPRTNDYVAPTLAEHWIAGMEGTFDGVNRNTGGGGGVTIAATPPTPAVPGMLWWDSVGGQLYVYYNDGNSQQWVVANNSTMQATVGNPTIVNVLDHGAKGDGVTDDTAAIQAVLNAYAGKAIVLVPLTSSSFLVTGLVMPSNTEMLLNGTILMKSGTNAGGAGVVNVNSGVANVIIRGYGVIDGNDAGFTGNVISAGLSSFQASNIRVYGITIRNSHYWNLNVTVSSNVVMNGVTLLGGHAANEFAAESSDCWLVNCLIDGTGNGDYGFCFYGGVTNSGAIGSQVRNAGLGTAFGPPGIGVLSDSAQSGVCSNIVIADNIIHGCAAGGITILGGTNGAGAIQNGIIISGNRCYNNCQNPAPAGQVADCFMEYTDKISIIGNHFGNSNGNGTGIFGVYLVSNNSNIDIKGNQIYNVGTGSLGQENVGIFNNGATHLDVSGNRIYDDQTTPTMPFSIVGASGVANSYVGNFLERPIAGLSFLSDTVCMNYGFGAIGIASGRLFAGFEPVGYTNATQVVRWYAGNTGSTESGGNTGSDFGIYSVNDAGSGLLANPILINRATGLVTIGTGLVVATSMAVPTIGIKYGASNVIGFSWTGAALDLAVDGVGEGVVLTTTYVGLNPLPHLVAAVGSLPVVTLSNVGSTAFATDGRNTGEGAAAGSGCIVQVQNKSGTATWCAVWSGVAVTA